MTETLRPDRRTGRGIDLARLFKRSDRRKTKRRELDRVRSTLRVVKWLFVIVLLIVVLVLCAILFLAGTNRGFDIAMQQASEHIDGLEINQPSGNLNDGVASTEVIYNNEQVAIRASGIDTAWKGSCLWDKNFCIQRMVIDTLHIESFATEKDKRASTRRTSAIELPAFDIPIDVNIDDVTIRELIFQPPGNVPAHIINNINFQAENTGNKITLKYLAASYKNFQLIGSGEISTDTDYPLNLVVDVAATDLIDQHDANLKFTLFKTVKELGFGLELSGAAEATLYGNVSPLEPNLPMQFKLNAEKLGWPLDTHTLAQARDVRFDLDGDLDDYNLLVSADISGQSIPATTIDITGKANPNRLLVPDITLQTLDGFATGHAAINLEEQISWISNLIIKDIDIEKLLPDVPGNLNGIVALNGGIHAGKWMLNVEQADFEGELRGIAFDLYTQVTKTYDDQWRVQRVLLNNGRNKINATGKAGELLDFTADIQLPELQNLMPGLAGGFTGELKISGRPQAPSVDFNAKANVVKFNDILVTGLTLNTDIDRDARDPSSLVMNVEAMQAGTQKIRNIRFNLDGTRQAHGMKLLADGPHATALRSVVTGSLTEQFDWNGELASVDVELPAHKIQLAKSTEFGWKNDLKKFRVAPHCWRSEETNLCLDNEVLAAENGEALVSLRNYPLSRLDPFLPANSELQGGLRADATLKWGEQFPGGYSAEMLASISDGGLTVIDDIFDELSFAYESFSVDANANGNSVAAKVSMRSNGLGNANVDITMDPTVEEKPIQGILDLTGFDVSFLKAFLPQFEKIGGVVNTKGNISGNLTDPRFVGEVVLDEPVIQAEILPLSFDGGQLTAQVDGNRANLSGELVSGKGDLTLSGFADWTELKAWRAKVGIQGKNLNVQTDPLVESSVNTDVQINLQPARIDIRGDVSVPSARVLIAEIPEGAVELSEDVVVIEDVVEKINDEKAAEAASTAIKIKMNVSLGEDVRLEGYGLKAKVEGDMTVEVEPPKPVQLGGDVRIVEGIFKKYGQDLKVQDGQVIFVGPIDKTSLNMDAVREIDGEDRIAGLRVEGPLAEPVVTLFTEPANKSQDAILSYVLLGRDINEASDEDQNLLASAALALTVTGSRGVATKFVESLGIKDFALDARGRGDETEVVVSGRLNDRLLVRYGQSVFTGANTLYLRYDITRKLYLEAAQGLERAVDLFYSFSF